MKFVIKHIKLLFMRTTIDIPQDLLRQAKAQAALRGLRLKDFVAEAVELALAQGLDTASVRGSRHTVGEGPQDRQILSVDCMFPLIRGNCGPAMRDLTPEKIHQILEEEEVERALDPGRR